MSRLALEVAALAPGGGQLLLAPGLGCVGRRALLFGAGQGDLDVRKQLPGSGGDGLRHGRLVPQPRPALLGTRACLAFRAGGPVQ